MNSKSSPQIVVHGSSCVTFTAFHTTWFPNSSKFVVLGEKPNKTGIRCVYELDAQAKLKKVKDYPHRSGLKCGTFGASMPGKVCYATGSFDGKLEIWDFEKPLKPIFSVKAHENIINSIDGCGGLNIGNGAPEIVTSGKDGHVKVWDPRQKEPVSCMSPMEGQKNRDCWTCCFGNSYDNNNRSVCAGYDNGDVKLLDLTAQKVQWQTNLKNGVCSVEFDRKDIKQNKLLCTTLESSFAVFDMRTFNKNEGYASMINNKHPSTIWVGAHSPHNRDVWCTCGGNGEVRLWEYEYPSERSLKGRGVMGNIKMLAEKKISTQPIASWNWNTDKKGLACCATLDQKISVIFATRIP